MFCPLFNTTAQTYNGVAVILVNKAAQSVKR